MVFKNPSKEKKNRLTDSMLPVFSSINVFFLRQLFPFEHCSLELKKTSAELISAISTVKYQFNTNV